MPSISLVKRAQSHVLFRELRGHRLVRRAMNARGITDRRGADDDVAEVVNRPGGRGPLTDRGKCDRPHRHHVGNAIEPEVFERRPGQPAERVATDLDFTRPSHGDRDCVVATRRTSLVSDEGSSGRGIPSPLPSGDGFQIGHPGGQGKVRGHGPPVEARFERETTAAKEVAAVDVFGVRDSAKKSRPTRPRCRGVEQQQP